MSIDHFHFVAKGQMPVQIDRAEAATKLTEEAQTIYEMLGRREELEGVNNPDAQGELQLQSCDICDLEGMEKLRKAGGVIVEDEL